MRWRNLRRSTNIEDRRRTGKVAMAGGGLGTIALIIIVLALGGDPTALLSPGGTVGTGNTGRFPQAMEDLDNERADFVAAVLGDTEEVWHALFDESGRRYEEPTLVMFRGEVRSTCGFATAASGPFYCPSDSKVYLDLSFFDELEQSLGAPGDFAQAYVIAHEIGHHVQHLLGTTDRVHAMRGRLSETEYNQVSVRLELQADFLAGVWAHHAQRMRQVLESGDIEEALRAASAIGDDRLQRQAQGYVVPDSFTHGTSAQRVRWFRRGLETGRIEAGDTFSAENP